MSLEFLDMSVELQELLRDHGRQVFLRQKQSQRCHCWDARRREANPNCSHCSKTGWLYTDKKVLSFKWVPTQPTSGAYRKVPTPIGFFDVDEALWFIEDLTQQVYPSSQDSIVECVTDADGLLVQPYKIQRIWDVNDVVDLRERHSQLSFYCIRTRKSRLGK